MARTVYRPGPHIARRHAVRHQLVLIQEEKNSHLVITARGELDLSTSEQLAAVLQNGASAKDVLMIDLRGVTFMDCAGLRVLMYANRRAQISGQRLLLTRPSRVVRRLARLTGTESRLPFVDESWRNQGTPT